MERIRQAITPKTRVIEFPHITNLTGQILPVRDVVRLARERGIPVFVDGAHSFAHFPFTRDELDCDYFATSLHKWLLAPIGTGFLYVRKARIKTIWPLMAAPRTWMKISASTRRSAPTRPRTTTRSPPRWRSTRASATSARPRGCDTSATGGPSRSSRPATASRSGRRSTTTTPPAGSRLVGIEGIDPGKLSEHLFARHKILTVAIHHKDFSGIRVTPNVYTTPAEIDAFTEAMRRVLAQGIS